MNFNREMLGAALAGVIASGAAAEQGNSSEIPVDHDEDAQHIQEVRRKTQELGAANLEQYREEAKKRYERGLQLSPDDMPEAFHDMAQEMDVWTRDLEIFAGQHNLDIRQIAELLPQLKLEISQFDEKTYDEYEFLERDIASAFVRVEEVLENHDVVPDALQGQDRNEYLSEHRSFQISFVQWRDQYYEGVERHWGDPVMLENIVRFGQEIDTNVRFATGRLRGVHSNECYEFQGRIGDFVASLQSEDINVASARDIMNELRQELNKFIFSIRGAQNASAFISNLEELRNKAVSIVIRVDNNTAPSEVPKGTQDETSAQVPEVITQEKIKVSVLEAQDRHGSQEVSGNIAIMEMPTFAIGERGEIMDAQELQKLDSLFLNADTGAFWVIDRLARKFERMDCDMDDVHVYIGDIRRAFDKLSRSGNSQKEKDVFGAYGENRLMLIEEAFWEVENGVRSTDENAIRLASRALRSLSKIRELFAASI